MKTKTVPRVALSVILVLLFATLSFPAYALTVFCPPGKNVECGDTWSFDTPTYTNACCTDVSITVITNQSSGSACVSVHTRIWSVSDCCTNLSGICTQYVQVVDTRRPQFSFRPSNMVLDCTGANGRIVNYTSPTAVDHCDSIVAVVCEPPSGTFFYVGTTLVTCTTRDACGNSNFCSFTITVQNNCPSNSCISIQCPQDIRLPCSSSAGTPVLWVMVASNHCNPAAVSNWSEPPSGSPFEPGIHTVKCYASNTFGGEVQTCAFTVEIYAPAPQLSGLRASGPFSRDRLILGWVQGCREFGVESLPRIGSGGGWSPFTDLPFAHWTRPNLTNNAIDHFLGTDIPLPRGDPIPDASFFRLSTDPAFRTDFSSSPIGPLLNQHPNPDDFGFQSIGGGQLQIVNINGSHVLKVDDHGVTIFMPTNRVSGPDRLAGAPSFHEVTPLIVGYVTIPGCVFFKAFDTSGQLVDAAMSTNVFAPITLRSRGFPLQRLEAVAEPNEQGGIMSITGRPRPLSNPNGTPFTGCLDFTSFPTDTTVPNPWELPGYRIGSTNFSGSPEPLTYIEAGPDGYGNGYHVEHVTTITMTTNCCHEIQVELITQSGEVQVQSLDDLGAEIETFVVIETGGLVTVAFSPSTAPVCRVVITASAGQTRLLRVCCVPALITPPPPPPPPGTNSNPLVRGPWTFQIVSGGLFGSVFTYIFPHNGILVFDLGTESLITFATAQDKAVFDVFSESSNGGMEFEAVDAFDLVVARAGPLQASQFPQTMILDTTNIWPPNHAPLIKAVRIKTPGSQGYLINAWGIPK